MRLRPLPAAGVVNVQKQRAELNLETFNEVACTAGVSGGNALSFLSRLHLKKFVFQKRDAVGSCGVNTLASICFFFPNTKLPWTSKAPCLGALNFILPSKYFQAFIWNPGLQL